MNAPKLKEFISKSWANVEIRSALYYTVGNISTALVPFAMLPILTRYLSPEEYGILSMYTVFMGILNGFTGISVHGAIAREYVDLGFKKMGIFVFNGFLIVIITTLLTYFAVQFFRDEISSVMGIDSFWLGQIVVVSGAQYFVWIILTLLQMQKKALFYGVIQLGSALVQIAIMLWLVVGLDYTWTSKLYSQLFVFVCIGGLGIVYLWAIGLFRVKIDFAYLSQIIKFGVPLIPHTISMFAISYTDRVMINNLFDLQQVGIYAVGAQFGMVMLFVQDAVNKAWMPWFYEKMSENSLISKKLIVNKTYLIGIAYLGVLAVYLLIATLLFDIMVGIAFREAIVIMYVIGFGFLLNGYYKLATNYLFYGRKTGMLSLITTFSAIINVVLNIYFLSILGTIGAAWATMISFGLSFLLTAFIAKGMFEMHWRNSN